MARQIVVGKIDRISGSGNGMLIAGGKEYNLGPVNISAVGNTAIAVPMTSPWAVCLTPYNDLEVYLSRFHSITGIDKTEIKQQLQETKDQQMDLVSDFFSEGVSPPDSTDFAVGDSIEVQITVGTSNRSYVIFEDGTVIEVVDTYLPAGEKTTLELVEVTEMISKARLSSMVLERAPKPGSELIVTIQEKDGSTGYAICDGVPIVLPYCVGAKGDKLRVGVESLEPNGVRATVAALPAENRPEVGDILHIDVDFSGGSPQVVRFIDGIPLEISQPARPMNGVFPIVISEIKGNSVSAHIDFTSYNNAPKIGTELTVTIEQKTDSTGYSSQNGVPIVLPECSASVGDTLRVTVTEYLETGVEATMAASPAGTRPSVGDVLTLEVEIPANDSTTVLIRDGISIEIIQTALSMEGALPIEIIELRANTAVGRVNLAAYSGLSEGTQLTLEGLTYHDDQLIGKQDRIPIIIPLSRPIPSVPDSIPITVTEIKADAAYASIRHRPEIRGLRDGAGITVTTTGRIDEYLVAEYEGYPVWVSWPFDETERPPRLTVKIFEIMDCGLFASLPVFSDMEVSRCGDVLPGRVEAVHSDHISASIVELVKGESYVLPVTIPVSFDISGEIGIEIVGQEQSHLVGIVRTLDTGENATQVPVYLQKVQETILAIREKQFKNATESAQAAADATETVVRRAEALRFQIFASGESILSTDGTDQQVLNEIANPSEKVASLNLSNTYRDLINTELDIHEELLLIGADQVPDSVQGLQRIAYDVDTRGRLNRLAGRIRRELLEMATDVEFDEWVPEFPNHLLVYRVAQICTQFEFQPEMASKLVNQYPPIERLQWGIPPESSPEPSPDETMSVVPKTLDSYDADDESSDTVEASGDGLSGSDSSATTAHSPDDQLSSSSPPVATSKDNHNSGELPEDQLATDVDSDSSSPVETTDSTREPAKESGGTESAPTDAHDVAKINEVIQDNTISDSESIAPTTPTTPPPSQIRALRAEAEAAASENPIRDTSSTGGGSRYQRSPAIKKYVQVRANGVCEACGEPAPFETPDGRPYLETHHVDELGQGGKDHPDKVAAVCPTCHKRIHYGADGTKLNEALRQRLEDGLANVGAE